MCELAGALQSAALLARLPGVHALPRAPGTQPLRLLVPGVVLAGTQKIWIRTFGCSHNSSDSEFMAGQLQEYGYR